MYFSEQYAITLSTCHGGHRWCSNCVSFSHLQPGGAVFSSFVLWWEPSSRSLLLRFGENVMSMLVLYLPQTRNQMLFLTHLSFRDHDVGLRGVCGLSLFLCLSVHTLIANGWRLHISFSSSALKSLLTSILYFYLFSIAWQIFVSINISNLHIHLVIK